MAITSEIVIVNTQVTSAPTPSTLQRSGALISVGATTLTAGTYQFCANTTDVAGIISDAGNFAEITNAAAEFFAQGSGVGVYVLELGASGGVAATQITSLGTWITANSSPQIFYAYQVPASWDSTTSSNMATLAGNYASPSSKTYFFVQTTSAHLSAYATIKSVYTTVPSPTAGGTEVQSTVSFYNWLVNQPSLASPTPPMDFRFVFGVTPWTQNGNNTMINTILTGFGNVILTGAEGRISTSLIRNGTMMDGNQAMFWYAVDWLQINAKQAVAAATINGSNSNPPLYYNQFGISYLLKVLQVLCNTGISIGQLLAATPSAVSFATYVAENPGDYAIGKYAGFSIAATPQLGFEQIIIFLDATTIAA